MADINRNIDGDLILKDEKLRQMNLVVLINEKLNQLKKLDVHLDQLRTVEMKRIELKKETLMREISELKKDLNNPQVIDVEPNK